MLNSKPTQESTPFDGQLKANSGSLIHRVGYAILALACLDYLMLLIPPQFLQPIWEFETIGKFVELVWAPLLGYILIFYRQEQNLSNRRELRILSILSWLALGLGILYLIMIPLLVNNSIRIYQGYQAGAINQLDLQSTQTEEVKQQLNQATPEQLESIISQDNQTETELDSSPGQIKDKLITRLEKYEQANKDQIKTALQEKRNSLLKVSIKWTIGAIIAGVAFILVWQSTAWARDLVRVLRDETFV